MSEQNMHKYGLTPKRREIDRQLERTNLINLLGELDTDDNDQKQLGMEMY